MLTVGVSVWYLRFLMLTFEFLLNFFLDVLFKVFKNFLFDALLDLFQERFLDSSLCPTLPDSLRCDLFLQLLDNKPHCTMGLCNSRDPVLFFL